MRKLSVGACINVFLLLFFAVLFSGLLPDFADARNVRQYSDTITDSAPLQGANHTFNFILLEDIPAGGVLQFDFPVEFNLPATSTFAHRSVELLVNGVPRVSGDAVLPGQDGVTITTGNGGDIMYELNPTTAGLHADDEITVLVGNQTSTAIGVTYLHSTSTGTTTVQGDPEPVINPSTPGTYVIEMSISGGVEAVTADFNAVVIPSVGVGGDTTETDPPYRFDGLPEGEIGGTTLSVEISLHTDEFAVCKWSTASGTPFITNPNIMTNTGLVQHSQIVAVAQQQLNTFFIRCIDDEGNFNTDDFLIAFVSPPPPDGDPNAEGEVEGNGTGTGNEGAGGGTGGGGSSSGSDGNGNSPGGSSGGGGSGGGSGGKSGNDDEDQVGGGFESSDGPYRSGDARVFINGYAFPGSTVYAVVDGYIADSVKAGSDGKYALQVDEIARGVYTFGVYAIDDNDVKSSTFSTSFTVTGGRTSSLSNINVMPSILVTPDPVDVGQTVTISGFALPNASITIENQKDGVGVSKKIFTTTSDADGAWSIPVDTTNFSQGTYQVKAKSESLDGSIETDYSEYTYYGVGQEAENQIFADLNRDGKVNLTDFSILLFWWGSDGGDSDPPADINGDGSVSLTDFSILLFNWTG